MLGLGQYDPIPSLRKLCEFILEIPLVQLSLPRTVSGATIANSADRGIAVNTSGENAENVWVRRATIAHELGHLLWDPSERLEKLRVDEYRIFDTQPWWVTKGFDRIEQRANAFAVEFLAPQPASVAVFRAKADPRDGLRSVMETFGISFSAARHHVANGMGLNDEERRRLTVDDTSATADWMGREAYAADYFDPDTVHLSRRGRFAEFLELAVRQGIVSRATFCQYLNVSPNDFDRCCEFIRQIYPPHRPAANPAAAG